MPKTLPAFLLLLLSLSLAGQQWDFRQSGSLLGFRPLNFISCEAVPGQGLRCVGHSNAYLFTPPELALRAEDYDYLVIDYQGDAPAFPIYFSRNGAPPSEETRLNGRPVPGRRQHIYPLLGHPQWKDTITLLRFDVVLTEGGQADVRRIRLVKELPVDLDGAQIPNGDFSQGSEGWEGDTASISPLQATLPPGATLLSPWGEVPYTGRYLLDAEFDGAPQATLECRDILGNPLESLEVSLPCTFTSPAMAAEVRVKFVNPTQEPVHLKRVSLLGIPADMSLETALQEFHNGRPLSSSQGNVPLFSGSWLWEESLVDLPQRTALFLREFVLEDPASLASAFLYLTADNEGEAALNGTPPPPPLPRDWEPSAPVPPLPRELEAFRRGLPPAPAEARAQPPACQGLQWGRRRRAPGGNPPGEEGWFPAADCHRRAVARLPPPRRAGRHLDGPHPRAGAPAPGKERGLPLGADLLPPPHHPGTDPNRPGPPPEPARRRHLDPRTRPETPGTGNRGAELRPQPPPAGRRP